MLKDKTLLKKIIGSLVLFVVIFSVGIWVVFPDMASRGQFGDMFGVVNAIFSGLAFLGVIYAVILQQKELQLQRKELSLTREELKRTAEAQEKSEEALNRQASSLKITAKLNGLSAVLQHYNTLIELTNSAKYGINTAEYNTRKREADKIINEIKQLIENK